MNLISIDFGLAKAGVAIAFGPIAEPYQVVRYKEIKILIKRIKEIIEKEKSEKLIIGISEGYMAQKTREFILELKKEIQIPIQEYDETLSTQDAQMMAIEGGMKRSKRQKQEDAIAAAILLQNYMDEN